MRPGSEGAQLAQELLSSTLTWLANYRHENPELTDQHLIEMLRSGRLGLDVAKGNTEAMLDFLIETMIRLAKPEFVTVS